MEGGQTGTVFVNQDDTNVDGEAFSGVIGEEEYTPVDSGEVGSSRTARLLSLCRLEFAENYPSWWKRLRQYENFAGLCHHTKNGALFGEPSFAFR